LVLFLEQQKNEQKDNIDYIVSFEGRRSLGLRILNFEYRISNDEVNPGTEFKKWFSESNLIMRVNCTSAIKNETTEVRLGLEIED
jgi:hypothetical protein